MSSNLRFPPVSVLTALLLLPLSGAGCTDTTTPGLTTSDGVALFDGSLDPSDSTFVLKSIVQPFPGQEPVRVDLIGSNFHIIRGGVALDVAIRNIDRRPLYAPAMVWLSHLDPSTVIPRNADVIKDSTLSSIMVLPHETAYGFDYSDFLGSDRVLSPGETSAAIPWRFENPELVPFSFLAEAFFSLVPNHAEITGYLFEDTNQNGIRDQNESAFPWAEIRMQTPDGTVLLRQAGPDGGFRFPAYEAGLYTLTFESLVDCVLCVTTPNPLQVVLVPGQNGLLQSYHDADFGAVCGLCTEPVALVLLTNANPADIEQDLYTLTDAWLEGDILSLQVGYAGCQPEHPFILYAGRDFQESNPVQTWMLLAYDDLGEACFCQLGAFCYFEKILQFDLDPIRKAHIEDYGAAGVVRLLLRDFRGNQQAFTFGP